MKSPPNPVLPLSAMHTSVFLYAKGAVNGYHSYVNAVNAICCLREFVPASGLAVATVEIQVTANALAIVLSYLQWSMKREQRSPAGPVRRIGPGTSQHVT